MIKFIVSILLTALLAFASCLFFTWWSIAVAAFIVSIAIPKSPLLSFLAGFAGLFLLWGIQSMVIDSLNNHILSSRIAKLFQLGSSSVSIIIITTLVGSIIAGMASLTASFLGKNSYRK